MENVIIFTGAVICFLVGVWAGKGAELPKRQKKPPEYKEQSQGTEDGEELQRQQRFALQWAELLSYDAGLKGGDEKNGNQESTRANL